VSGMSEQNLSTTTVRPAGSGEQDTVVGVITLAFSTDPMARWSFPDPATYLAVMPDLARAFGGRSFGHGTADLVEGGFAQRCGSLLVSTPIQNDSWP
jgi:hypothetical protein